MATPTTPTVTTLITEAFRRCGIANPTSAQLLRATDEWFEEVKRDIASRKTWHSNEETMVVIPQPYLQVYAMPSPVQRVLRVRFYRGTKTGTAQAGSADTITIAAGTGDANDRGKKIFLTGGTGQAQVGRITGVSGAVYTISCDWETNPSTDTTYMIADTERPVVGPERLLPLHGISPSTSILQWDFVEHNLRVWPPVDNAVQYALEVDGDVDLSLIDTADARLTRLVREWREPLVRGVMVRIKEDQDDPDVDRDERKYEKAVLMVMKQDGRKRLRAEAPAAQSVGGTVRGR